MEEEPDVGCGVIAGSAATPGAACCGWAAPQFADHTPPHPPPAAWPGCRQVSAAASCRVASLGPPRLASPPISPPTSPRNAHPPRRTPEDREPAMAMAMACLNPLALSPRLAYGGRAAPRRCCSVVVPTSSARAAAGRCRWRLAAVAEERRRAAAGAAAADGGSGEAGAEAAADASSKLVLVVGGTGGVGKETHISSPSLHSFSVTFSPLECHYCVSIFFFSQNIS